jgi:hypothetical protein
VFNIIFSKDLELLRRALSIRKYIFSQLRN